MGLVPSKKAKYVMHQSIPPAPTPASPPPRVELTDALFLVFSCDKRAFFARLGTDGPSSTLGLAVFPLLYIILSFCFCMFLKSYSPPCLVSLYSYCWPITASGGFCDKLISSNVYLTLAHSSAVLALFIEIFENTWKS